MAFERALQRAPAVADRRPAPALVRAPQADAPTAAPSARLAISGSGVVQRFANVSSPSDRAETEAVSTARAVMRMSAPSSPAPVAARASTAIHRAPLANAPALNPRPAQALVPGGGGGGAGNLPAGVRNFMEPRLGADFSGVRVHTDAAAAQRSASIGAQAFTAGKDIHFGAGRFQPDTPAGKELIAHELTHTIQQGAVKQGTSLAARVRERPATGVHRAGGILDWFADKANYIPGFRMFCIVLGVNPINMAAADRSAGNVLRAVIEFIPGGKAIGDALQSHGIFDRIGGWVDQKLRALSMVGGAFKSAIDKFVAGISTADILWVPGWGDMWDSAKRIFTEPIARIKDFVAGLATEIIQFIREAILLPLAALAEGTKGYDLLKAVLGEDPVTGQPVPRTPETLIGGFMKLIGQEEVWENAKKSGAIPRAWAWFQGALAGLMGYVKQIPTLVVNAFRALEVTDMILVPRAFLKIAGVFGNFIVQFISWAGNTVWTLLEIIFEVVSPATLTYLKKTGTALKGILKNPLPFVRNLVNAAKLGFQNFAENFGSHLKAGLIDWLTGSLEGVYVPKALSLPELGKFAISVLGISWAQIRGKIVKVLGPSGETIMKGMETGFDIVVALVKGGPAAAWELIKEKLSDLKDQVVSGIIGFVTDTVVKKAIPKLISMFIPGAGFISAIISIYDTIMVFVEKISKIIQVVTAFIDSIVAIAAGNITAAANRVERILGNLLSLAVSFLAGFLGLGKVTDKIKEVIEKVRISVDKAIDAAIAWIVDKAKKLFAKGKAAVADWWKKPKPFRTEGGESHELTFVGDEKTAVPMVASKNKKSVPEHGAAFKKKASSPEATPAQKAKAALIDATIALAKIDPNDPALVTNMQLLFETYDEGGAVKEAKITRVTGNIGGSTVGMAMTIENLNKKHPPGTPSSSGEQVPLMDQLITEPKTSSENKFIRGHLLNENLGGPGVALNMFPITANANKNHLTFAESTVKKWVENPKNYVWYEVKVAGVSAKLNGKYKHTANYVNSQFICSAKLTKPDGTTEILNKTIPSEYQVKHTKETTDFDTKTK